MTLPGIASFVSSPLDDQVKVLDTLFEHSDSLVWFTLRNKEFMSQKWGNYLEFIDAVRLRLVKLCKDTEQEGISSRGTDHLVNIIASHPRLGEPKKQLSIHSLNEQRNLGGQSDSAEVQEKLRLLNKEYENAYEGLRFVVFVNGRTRSEIIQVMQRRISSGNTWYQEACIAINEMCDIAEDRAKKCSKELQKYRM